MSGSTPSPITPSSPEAFINRELSWLAFARRVLELAQDGEVPLLERVKFAGILGMLHDEFFMKRIGGLKRQIQRGAVKRSLDGLLPAQELAACREEILAQARELSALVRTELRPGLAAAGLPILDVADLSESARAEITQFFRRAVLPVLTPLAVDAEHPFPFISGLGLNLAVTLAEKKRKRFVRIKVPANRSRWVRLAGGGVVPLEQVIAANLGELFPRERVTGVHYFRLTRGVEAEDEVTRAVDDAEAMLPGSIIRQVTDELKARRFAGVVRLQVSADMPAELQRWLAEQVKAEPEDLYQSDALMGLSDLMNLPVEGRQELRFSPHRPVTPPRLEGLEEGDPAEFFAEIRRGDILLHHPYHSFDTSVLRFLECAAADPQVLAIKLTIYRTSSDSPIVRALLEAVRRGKQVAVLVEITARFDEAPNIAWGRLLEQEGVHVSYGVEKLKTHVKLAMVVREEGEGELVRYVHLGTGNYHTGTARAYEDLGMLSCNEILAAEVAAVFNELTSATPCPGYSHLLVAPANMRERFKELIQREIDNAREGRPSGIRAKMNQLQDPAMIRELYRASQAGVPITLNVRGLCCLRPGVPGLSENIRVYSVVGRFLEHGRIYWFENGGTPEVFIGSADWMKRNLDGRVETIAPIADPALREELRQILDVYDQDNASAWDLQPDGTYRRRRPQPGEPARPAQEVFIAMTREAVQGG
ncbi:MAG: polyphosphate kinase 1 [Acidobacteriota bacterium]|jgi:polyphosphate kinase